MTMQVLSERRDIVYIPADKLRIAPCNVRKVVGDLNDLIESIKEHGILEPLICRPAKDGAYEIVAGRRRFEAGLKAGLREFPCIIRELNDLDCLALSYSENLQRQNLDIEEEIDAVKRLLSQLGSETAVAKKLGVTKGYISQILSVARAIEMLRGAISAGRIAVKKEPKPEEREKGTLSFMHALAISKLSTYVDEGLLSSEDVEKVAKIIAKMETRTAANYVNKIIEELEIEKKKMLDMRGRIERIPIDEVLSRVQKIPVKVEIPVDLVVRIREKGEDESEFIARVVEESINEEVARNVYAPVIKNVEEAQREMAKAVGSSTPWLAIVDVLNHIDSLAEELIKGNDEVTMDWIRQLVDESVGREKLRSKAPVIRRVGQTLIKMADYIERGEWA